MAAPAALRAGSLEELKKEPWRLQIQADTTAEQLRALVLRNYRVFIQSNQSANIVKDELAELKDRTEQIMVAIPELKAFCTGVQEDTEAIVAQHSDIQFVFDHYMQLTELLEIPQLLEACIHNELFDSALDVIQFARDTFHDQGTTTSETNFVIEALAREVSQMTTLLRDKLLQKLREDLPLAVCVRVVGFLRRLDTLGSNARETVGSPEYERQLKEEFLRCRTAWLASLARSIPTTDAYQFTIQLIDIKRTSWFDMITQYSAIFGSENVDGKVDPPLCRWATTTVADFIQILMRQLPKIDDFSSLATVLEQSLFFGGSLGRVGVDFRAVLVVYFEDHVVDLMASSWEAACQDFESSLGAHALSGGSGSAAAGSKTPIVLASYRHALANSSTTQATPFAAHTGNGDHDFSPPRVLMSFPILAELTNALLSSFNELRLCTIVSVETRLAKRLQLTLAAVVGMISAFVQENRLALAPPTTTNDSASENGTRPTKVAALADAIRDMNEILAKELLPYIARCFQRLFPVTSSTTKAPSSSQSTLDTAALAVQMRELGLLL